MGYAATTPTTTAFDNGHDRFRRGAAPREGVQPIGRSKVCLVLRLLCCNAGLRQGVGILGCGGQCVGKPGDGTVGRGEIPGQSRSRRRKAVGRKLRHFQQAAKRFSGCGNHIDARFQFAHLAFAFDQRKIEVPLPGCHFPYRTDHFHKTLAHLRNDGKLGVQ